MESLNNILLQLLDAACPVKTATMTNKDPTYMTQKLKILLKKKYAKKRRAQQTTEIDIHITNT